MFRVIKEFQFCYGHRLPEYHGKCAHLHGHNARLEIEVEARELDQVGMVEDFSRLRAVLGKWLDETIDHKMILYAGDPMTDVLRKMGEPVYVMDVPPTSENICRMIFEKGKEFGFNVVRARFWERDSASAVYEVE